ncbi:hypothetical protein Y032_0181g860 [Ancylostoma ceylanicum]|uniref:Uncharacterized protein n=1 Tax=Ancylostoma ceylanicum TaxID=53326 RepID=A0A016STA4_9BILA|nr:hypothetical protein Y032_0181g860 [Ancylostoma ceylanicum]
MVSIRTSGTSPARLAPLFVPLSPLVVVDVSLAGTVASAASEASTSSRHVFASSSSPVGQLSHAGAVQHLLRRRNRFPARPGRRPYIRYICQDDPLVQSNVVDLAKIAGCQDVSAAANSTPTHAFVVVKF